MKKFFFTVWTAFSVPFRQLTSQDIKALAVCMLLSTVFWLSVTLSKTYSTSYTLHIRLLSQVHPVQVEVKGSGWSLLRLSFHPLLDTLAFTLPSNVDVLPARRLLPIIKQHFPDDLEITIISPENIILYEPSRLTTKKIRLLPPTEQINELLCDSCYIASAPTVEPSHLTVEGKSEKIKLLPDTLVLPLYALSINEDFDISYRSRQLISQKDIQLQPDIVRLHFGVGYFQQITLQLPVEQKDFPEKGQWQIHPSKVKVQLSGKAEDLEALKTSPRAIQAWVSFEESSSRDSLRVQVSTSLNGIQIKAITPSQVKLLQP
jgi:hypothetical protein